MQKVTVLLPVKNGEKYLSESINSVLNQSFSDFEFLIFDDDSSDRTIEIINSYKDPRIKVFTGNAGYIANLNMGIDLAGGTYIARMDADDIMDPVRLEAQLGIMENTATDLCCTWINIFGEGLNAHIHGKLSGMVDNPLDKLLRGNFVAHPTVMLRKEFMIKHNLKYEHYPRAEDYKLWFEMAKKKGIFYVIPEALLSYRMSNEQTTAIHQEEVGEQSLRIHKEILKYLYGGH